MAIFEYKGQFGPEHVSFAVESLDELLAARKKIREEIGTPVPEPQTGPQTVRGTAGPAEPMEAAAATSFAKQCENGCGVMRHVNGGRSTKNFIPDPNNPGQTIGKPYPAFYVCNTCGAKVNAVPNKR